MTRLLVEVPDDVAEGLERKAEALGKSVSLYLADLARAQLTPGWPPGYFEQVVGALQDDTFRLPSRLPLEERDLFD
jgi:hypothetical protein